MTESRFLSYVLTESILLLCLGLGMLIFPKISEVSFGYMMFVSFVVYGGYKVISAVITRNFSRHFILDIIVGLILFLDGIFLLFGDVFDMMQIIGISGVYFILKSISSLSFAVQTRKTLNFWWMSVLLAVLEFIFGIFIIVMLTSGALWLIGVLTGLDFIMSGMFYMNMYISTKYVR